MTDNAEKEIKRLKDCIYAVVASLKNKQYDSALTLARVGMYGGSVLSPLDCEKFKCP